MKTRLLVLDIDETLVHTTSKVLAREPDYTFFEYSIYKRPHLAEFLNFCFAHFEVGVWSSASERYVSFITTQIFGESSKLKFAWSEKNCTSQSASDFLIKDLRKLRRFGYLVDEVRALDDSPEKYKRHPQNLVKIEPFFGSLEDNHLLSTISYLEGIRVAN